jgi:3-hydroxymyristoyl/3-hydroxydecanoyl-(acyl carrier protein) dehydratase
LPREATGKLTQAALRALAAAHLGPAPAAATASAGPAALLDAGLPITTDHPACDGHFPGQPLLPGAMLLSLVYEALALSPEPAAALGPAPGVANVKFLAPVRPGQRLRVRFGAPAGTALAFEALAVDDAGTETVAARGQLTARG